MAADFIKIRGVRVHNLRNINLDIPKNKLVAITGLSGSGKSSLAFDTLYAEGRRVYVESLSAYVRQFLGGVTQKPEADSIEGISPAISIDQRKASRNPRSTVGTITEIYDYLRLLFARMGQPHCPKCGRPISRQTVGQMIKQLLKLPGGKEIVILGPLIRGKKGGHQGTLEEIKRAGFIRVRVDGIIYKLEEISGRNLDEKKKHWIEVVVDGLILDKKVDKPRLADSLEMALKLGKGTAIAAKAKNKSADLVFSSHFACEKCGVSLPELEPRLFSFNSPFGACPGCQGLGKKLEVSPDLVIPNPNLTVAEGAIFPWSHASHKVGRQGYFWEQLRNLAEKRNFSLDVPVKELPTKVIGLILYGSQDFEGVIPGLERKYRETDSDYTRSEIERYMVEKKCEQCQGKRLKAEVLAVRMAGKTIDALVEMPINKAQEFFKNLKFKGAEARIGQPIVGEIINRLQFLIDVGLDYLTLERQADTLAGGEEQRIRLATQIGSKLTGVLYVLDEPSIGLHSRDQEKLISALKKLKNLGNSLVVVEHDSQTIMAADWVIDVGPKAGQHGGCITFQGTPKQLLKSRTLTGDYLSGKKKVGVGRQAEPSANYLVVKGAKEHNLKNIDVKIPLGRFVCLTGVSGSGKSSLMNDILAKALLKKFYKSKEEPGAHKEISGVEFLNKVVLVDQSPIGRTPRSNPATYTNAFTYIRDLFAGTKEAKIRNYQPGRFSFNVKGGRCELCEGQGTKKIEMYFLPDIYVQCPECQGKRFNKETLSVEYKGKDIAQVLEMTIEEALQFFKNVPGLYEKLKTLAEVGLGYVQLGQPAPSLSGGEAQRVKLAAELSKKATGKSLYILDEPTTGLHPHDIGKLVWILKSLVDKGNTVLIVEHNLDVIKNVDWIIDLGPEGGERGGYLVAEGTPLEISRNKKSHTGRYLKKALNS
jgi:excinuclease ABC subunit A